MCGILAYYNQNGISKASLKDSLEALQKIKHRGPDGEGVVLINTKTNQFKNLATKDTPLAINPNILFDDVSDFEFDLLLGHRRLSIFDLSTAGHQPMRDKSNENWITFNGEIYNFPEIKEELKSLGYSFSTTTDTEVILKAYDMWGEKCQSKFNGMWAFVIWDNQKKSLFVSKDRFGVKPLYIYNTNRELIFSSEIKQILAYKNLSISDNNATKLKFLNESYIAYNDETYFEGIERFRPSNSSVISLVEDNLKLNYKPFYNVWNIQTTSISEKDAEEKYYSLLGDAVKIRTRADVPWGVGLSGGLDSSSVLYFASQFLKQKNPNLLPQTFSAIFPNQVGDESEHIDNILKQIEVNKKTINPLEDFTTSDFERHIYHQEAPVLSTSYYAQYKVAQLVSENNVKVNLVGQGADEVLAGYHHYFYRYCRELILAGKVITYISEVNKYAQIKSLSANHLHRTILNEVKLAIKFKIGLAKIGGSISSKWNSFNQLKDLLKYDLTTSLLPNLLLADDRTAMAFSVETRHPFLDYRLVDFSYSLPNHFLINNGWQKYILRKTMSAIPDSIRWRKDKKGFTTPQEIIINNNKYFLTLMLKKLLIDIILKSIKQT